MELLEIEKPRKPSKIKASEISIRYSNSSHMRVFSPIFQSFTAFFHLLNLRNTQFPCRFNLEIFTIYLYLLRFILCPTFIIAYCLPIVKNLPYTIKTTVVAKNQQIEHVVLMSLLLHL